MSKYRLRIEKWDDENNMLLQSQVEIPENLDNGTPDYMDIIEETFKHQLHQFRKYEQDQSR